MNPPLWRAPLLQPTPHANSCTRFASPSWMFARLRFCHPCALHHAAAAAFHHLQCGARLRFRHPCALHNAAAAAFHHLKCGARLRFRRLSGKTSVCASSLRGTDLSSPPMRCAPTFRQSVSANSCARTF